MLQELPWIVAGHPLPPAMHHLPPGWEIGSGSLHHPHWSAEDQDELLHVLLECGYLEPLHPEPEGMCSLWHIDQHPDGMDLAAIGRLLGVTRERVRQIERDALVKLRAALSELGAEERASILADLAGPEGMPLPPPSP